ncbi:hypothetical protein [Corticicoccus populi]|uniref:Uncharacterized protein n=1 Tax=Corticicoccus populi TaxID=1812821 RepID=A0ABW5X090_9STAP
MRYFYDAAVVIVSTLILYYSMRIMDIFFNTVTSSLLLNVDFIRDYQSVTFFEEMAYHTIVSMIVYIILLNINCRLNQFYRFSIIFSVIIFGALYFVLTLAAEREIFIINSAGFIVWITGHCIYLVFVHYAVIWRNRFSDRN